MENYIFIIIAILLAVFGAIGSGKKRMAEAEGENGPSRMKPYSPLDDPLEDMDFMEEKPPAKPTKQEKTAPPGTAYQPLQRLTPIMGTNREEHNERARLTSCRNKTVIHPIMEDFSLKKAVIYSEILKRKY